MTKKTYVVLNKVTSAFILLGLAFFLWDKMGNMLGQLGIILVIAGLGILNVLFWWKAYKDDFTDTEKKKYRLIEIIVFCMVVILLIVMELCYRDADAPFWIWSFVIGVAVASDVSRRVAIYCKDRDEMK